MRIIPIIYFVGAIAAILIFGLSWWTIQILGALGGLNAMLLNDTLAENKKLKHLNKLLEKMAGMDKRP
jgi:hypothetical protein